MADPVKRLRRARVAMVEVVRDPRNGEVTEWIDLDCLDCMCVPPHEYDLVWLLPGGQWWRAGPDAYQEGCDELYVYDEEG